MKVILCYLKGNKKNLFRLLAIEAFNIFGLLKKQIKTNYEAEQMPVCIDDNS